MYILNFEDEVTKHHDIRKAVENAGLGKIKMLRADSLEEGLFKMKEAEQLGTPFDLIITDMWYPKTSAGKEERSGDILIQMATSGEIKIPMILCSSVDYSYSNILGTIHYSERENWEYELIQLIKRIALTLVGAFFILYYRFILE